MVSVVFFLEVPWSSGASYFCVHKPQDHPGSQPRPPRHRLRIGTVTSTPRVVPTPRQYQVSFGSEGCNGGIKSFGGSGSLGKGRRRLSGTRWVLRLLGTQGPKQSLVGKEKNKVTDSTTPTVESLAPKTCNSLGLVPGPDSRAPVPRPPSCDRDVVHTVGVKAEGDASRDTDSGTLCGSSGDVGTGKVYVGTSQTENTSSLRCLVQDLKSRSVTDRGLFVGEAQ